MRLKKALSILVPSALRGALVRMRARLLDIHAQKSYSQEGEDMVLERIFAGKKGGFYVDVGAHHPRRFSNTYFFYRKGWKGINIEPNPEAIHAFQSDRKRDTNLQCGISDRPGARRKRYAECGLCMGHEEGACPNPDSRRRATTGSPALVTA